MKERIGNRISQHEEFARLRRRVRAMQRQKVDPPQKMLERLIGLDRWLVENQPGWIANFPRPLTLENNPKP